jgi:phosphatidylserine decarboxylase
MTYIFFGILLWLVWWLYWRFYHFYRDPDRQIPEGNNIVSAADGTIIYIKKITKGESPISIKKNRKIDITDITRSPIFDSNEEHWIVGVFMHPTSVHVNRAPIEGEIKAINYHKGVNAPMTLTWWRVLLRIKPYERDAAHIIQNERNIISIKGKFDLHVVQIADIYVNKIRSYVAKNDHVSKGERIGAILLGSQVDIIFPCRQTEIVAEIGNKVKAGETIIAKIQYDI